MTFLTVEELEEVLNSDNPTQEEEVIKAWNDYFDKIREMKKLPSIIMPEE